MRCSSCGAALTRELAPEPLARPGEAAQPVQAGEWWVDPEAGTVTTWERGMPAGTTTAGRTDPAGCVVVHPADLLDGALTVVAGRSAGLLRAGRPGWAQPEVRLLRCRRGHGAHGLLDRGGGPVPPGDGGHVMGGAPRPPVEVRQTDPLYG